MAHTPGNRQVRSLPDPALALTGLLVAGSLAMLAWQLVYCWPFTVDDVFITLRYAANLASGAGPTFNAGQPPVEGTTSFLWMLLATIPHLLGIDAVWFVKSLGVLSLLGVLAITWLLTTRLCSFLVGSSRLLPAAFALFLLCGFYPTAVHAVSGMETALATLLLESLLFLVVTREPPRGVVVPIVGLLLGLTRPEANLVVVFVLAMWLWRAQAHRRKPLLLSVLCGYLLPGAIYFCWRTWYYGYLFPIPFYLKVLNPDGLAGASTVHWFVELMLVHGGILLAAAILRPNRDVGLVLLSGAIWIVTCILPASIMDYDWRFCCPVVPLLFSAVAFGLGALLARLDLGGNRLVGVVLLIVVATGAGFMKSARFSLRERQAYGLALAKAHVTLGRMLAGFAPGREEPPLLAIADAGAVPYYSGWRCIDTFGLSDVVIGIEGDHDPEYVLRQEPDLVILGSARLDRFEAKPEFPWEPQLYQSCQERGMVRLAAAVFSERYYLWAMGKPGSEIARYLRQTHAAPSQ